MLCLLTFPHFFFLGIQTSEKRAFDAVMEWGMAEGCARGLADMELLLPLIRYPLMSPEELQVGAPPHLVIM
jgi:hypothetical protein